MGSYVGYKVYNKDDENQFNICSDNNLIRKNHVLYHHKDIINEFYINFLLETLMDLDFIYVNIPPSTLD